MGWIQQLNGMEKEGLEEFGGISHHLGDDPSVLRNLMSSLLYPVSNVSAVLRLSHRLHSPRAR